MLARGLVASRAEAQALIGEGKVRLDGEIARRAALRCGPRARITLLERRPFVSRGGKKLAGALADFQLSPRGRICADVGASTGGFTDCLLQAGARRVYAIDVGSGQLHPRLRADERVIVRENCNARYVKALPQPLDWVVVDVSFISLTKILPALVGWLAGEAVVLALVKPQFELGPGAAPYLRRGVVRSKKKRRQAICSVLTAARAAGLRPLQLARSCLRGPAGNQEYFLHLGWRNGEGRTDADLLLDLADEDGHPTQNAGRRG